SGCIAIALAETGSLTAETGLPSASASRCWLIWTATNENSPDTTRAAAGCPDRPGCAEPAGGGGAIVRVGLPPLVPNSVKGCVRTIEPDGPRHLPALPTLRTWCLGWVFWKGDIEASFTRTHRRHPPVRGGDDEGGAGGRGRG